MHPGPSFAGSALIGGADGDLIADDLLLDFKSTHGPTTISKRDVYQLAGYVLLDFDGMHRIWRVGIYWTRYGILRTFTVDTFLRLLDAQQPVEQLRAELRTSLVEDRAPRQQAIRERRAKQQSPASTVTQASETPSGTAEDAPRTRGLAGIARKLGVATRRR
ncbi:hypothetical protein [Rhodococcus triatomae]